MTALPTQERVLRLERALAAAVQQERYTDAATLRDALAAARTSDPLLSKRAELAAAVELEDFNTAARLRDELAGLTERFARGDSTRRVDRIIVLRGRADPGQALRVATVSRAGDLQLPFLAEEPEDIPSNAIMTNLGAQPRVYLQPTWSPSGDYIAITEISFHIDPAKIARGVAVAETSSRLVIVNAFDGTLVRSVPLRKPPFFYFWSPDGCCVTLLSNDPTSSVMTVALSVIQVVAPAGATGGLDMESVTGPIASGHPFLYDFCPRDSSRIVAHMGDCDTVAIIPIAASTWKRRVLTSLAGAFGTPQWHPHAGLEGRECVMFVERDPTDDDLNDENDGNDAEVGDGAIFEKFLTNGTTLFESVLRKGAESLGLTGSKVGDFLTGATSGSNEDKKNEKLQQLEEKLRALMPGRSDEDVTSSMDGIDLDGEEVEEDGNNWGTAISEKTVQRLVMCDVDRPELKRTIAKFSGVMAFKLSPDACTLAMLVTNPVSGADELTLSKGDFSPDSVVHEDEKKGGKKGFTFNLSFRETRTEEADIILSTPVTRVLAFFWSPDGKKLLFLSSLRGSRIGAAQWATFDLITNKVVRYEKFVLSGIYIHCLNFFDQFAMSMTPWSPDSDAFCYPGRPLTKAELDREKDQSAGSSPALSALFLQKDGASDGKRFEARVQKVGVHEDGGTGPEEAVTIMENVEYACWSPC